MRVATVESRHEVVAVPALEHLHHRIRRSVIREDFRVSLVEPARQRVLRPAGGPRVGVHRRRDREPAEETLNVAVEARVGDRQGRIDVADERLRPVREPFVDPVDLARVLIALEQVLVFVREDALVEMRPCRGARTRVGRRVVRRVRAGAMRPVEGIDGHHVPIEERVDLRREESGDVREPAGVVLVVVVRVLHVGDERDDLVPVADVVVVRQAEQPWQLRLGAAPRRRHAERRRLLGIDVGIELVDQRGDLLIGDDVAHAVVAAVARREVQCAHRRGRKSGDDPLLNPDLDVLPDRAEGEAPESVGVERIIENGHQPHRSDGWIRRSSCLSALSGKRFERRGRSLLGRLDGKGSPLDGVACVLDADVDGLRQRPCCRCGHGGRDQQNDHGRESVLHVSSLGRRFDAVQQTRSGRIGRLAH